MPDSRTDVLIVGAGPVGLTAAAALTRQGLTCRIIDKAATPSDKSKALVVWCRTMELLDEMGTRACVRRDRHEAQRRKHLRARPTVGPPDADQR